MNIKVHFTKTALGDPALMQRLKSLPMPIATATAEHIQRRVQSEGRTATPFEGYSTTTRRHKKYWIGTEYAAKLGLTERGYDNSAQFHSRAGVKPGTFSTTGGMWSGLQVRNKGGSACIDFGGSTLGQSSIHTARYTRWREHDGKSRYTQAKIDKKTNKRALGPNGKILVRDVIRDSLTNRIVRRAASTMVRNDAKAAIVFESSKIGLLQPTAAETQAQLSSVAWASLDVLVRVFGKGDKAPSATYDGDMRLWAAITREMR